MPQVVYPLLLNLHIRLQLHNVLEVLELFLLEGLLTLAEADALESLGQKLFKRLLASELALLELTALLAILFVLLGYLLLQVFLVHRKALPSFVHPL